MYDGQDIHEPDVMIDDHEIPTSSQSMTNELLCLGDSDVGDIVMLVTL